MYIFTFLIIILKLFKLTQNILSPLGIDVFDMESIKLKNCKIPEVQYSDDNNDEHSESITKKIYNGPIKSYSGDDEESKSTNKKKNNEITTKIYDTYLIGGKRAKSKQFPYQVSLLDKYTKTFFCGGSIITKKHIITAAHCFCKGQNFKKASKIVVSAGTLLYKGTRKNIYDVSRTICHPKYHDVSKYHDIAMLAIKKIFVYKKHIKPVKMVVGGYSDPGTVVANLSVVITGWGSESFENAEASPKLQFITTLTMTQEKCKNMLPKDLQKYVKEWNICTFHPDQQRTCVGDSGGPVMYHGLILAVVSWSKKCDEDMPGVHTSIAHHYPWILKECAKDV